MAAAAVALAGCGGIPIEPGARIDLGRLEVIGGDPDFRSEVADRLAAINSGGGSPALLEIDEQRHSSTASLNADGSVARLALRYTFRYRLDREDGQGREGSFTFSRNLGNDDTAHLASIAARERFYANARKDALDSLVAELRFLELP